MRRPAPVYIVAAALLLAAFLGRVLPGGFFHALWPAGVLFALLSRMRPAALFLFVCAFMLYRQMPPVLDREVCIFQATVADFPFAMQPRGQRVAVRIDHSGDCSALQGMRAVLLDYAGHDFFPAARFEIRAAIRVNDGIFATVREARALPPGGHPVLTLRTGLDARIRARFSDGAARWFQALLIGNRNALQEADRLLLRDTGTSHLLAISGLHVAMVALMAYWVGKSLWSLSYRLAVRIAPRDAGLLAMLVFALCYVALSGAQAPALRAWVMLLGVSLHWFFPRVQSGLQGLALAAGVSVLVDPAMLFASGAWLSYLATVIVLLAWRRYRDRPSVVQWPLMQGWLTLALAPLSWAWFGGISVVGFFANLLVVPWLSMLLLLGFLGSAHAFFVPAAEGLLAYYLGVLHFFAALPRAYVEVFWQPDTPLALAVFLLAATVLARHKWGMALSCAACALLLFWQLWPKTGLYESPNGHAAVLHGRDGSIVVNPGYRYRERDDARRHILPELRRRGRRPVFIVITADRKNAHSALKTLLDAYPGTPVYSAVALKDFPFAVVHCPRPPFAEDCTMRFAGFHIGAQGIGAAAEKD